MATKYAVQSPKNNKFLSSLFTNKHNKAFQAVEARQGDCYFWDIKENAESAANEFNGIVKEFDSKAVGFNY